MPGEEAVATVSVWVEYPFLAPLIIAIIGIVLGFIYNSKKAKNDMKQYELSVEELAINKRRDELNLAKELKEDNKRLAIDVKDAMVNHISTVVTMLKADNELQKTILLSEINLMKKDASQIRNDMMGHIEQQRTINERMQKSIDFMNQFLWGAGAKSVPPFTEGEEETDEHRDEPFVGIFAEPDSSETQVEKDDRVKAEKEKERK